MTAISWAFRNVAKPVHLKMREVGSKVVDRRLGVVTADEAVAGELGVEIGEFRLLLRAMPWNAAYRLVRRLRLGPDDVLLDIGCGAGRVACLAGRTGMGRVIGIDLDPGMAGVAARNAAALRGRRCPIEIVEADATRFDVPDDVTCVYMYNPFAGEVLESVLRRLLASLDRRERRLRLVYANPKDHDRVVALGRFRPAGAMSLGWRPGREWARTQRVQFYDVEGSSARRPAIRG